MAGDAGAGRNGGGAPLLRLRSGEGAHTRLMPSGWLPGCRCLQALVDGKNFPDAIGDFNATLALLPRDASADVARARLLSGVPACVCSACAGLCC